MLPKVLIERHRFFDDLLVEHRGIEQVEPISMPYGNAEMSDVESGLLASDGDDVAVVDCLAHRVATLPREPLVDITEMLAWTLAAPSHGYRPANSG